MIVRRSLIIPNHKDRVADAIERFRWSPNGLNGYRTTLFEYRGVRHTDFVKAAVINVRCEADLVLVELALEPLIVYAIFLAFALACAILGVVALAGVVVQYRKVMSGSGVLPALFFVVWSAPWPFVLIMMLRKVAAVWKVWRRTQQFLTDLEVRRLIQR